MPSARTRPTTSVTPPPPTGMTIRTGRDGKPFRPTSWARAGRSAAVAAPARRRLRSSMAGGSPGRRCCPLMSLPCCAAKRVEKGRAMRPVTLQEPFRAVFYAPFYAALARGAYAAEGVEVRLLPGDAPAAVKDVVLSGAADFGWGGPMRLLLAHDADP